MKKTTLGLIVSGVLMVSASAMAKEATAVASWSATATKDTQSDLVVTPLGSLAFDYASGVDGFNNQKGLFDVTIQGHVDATDFTLKAQKVSGTLNHLSNPSTLDVGVSWNGQRLTQASQTTIIDTSAGIDGLNLSALASSYKIDQRTSAQESFTFDIEDATTNGTTSVAGDYSQLPDGIWSGDVKVRFIANWTGVKPE